MENFVDAFELTDVIVAVCIFLLGYLIGRVSGRARSNRKTNSSSWDGK